MPTKMFYGGTFLTNEDLKDAYDNHNMKLEYYKIEQDNLDVLKDEGNLYGIEIIKKEYNSESVIEESEQVLNVTNDENVLNQMLEVLKRNKVTPVSLENVIDDLRKK